MGLRETHPLVRLIVLAGMLVAGCGGPDRQGPSASALQRQNLDPRARTFLWDVQQAQQRQDFNQALALIDSAAHYAPDFADIFFLRGRVLTKLYRFNQAQAAFERVLELDPTYRSAAYNMGNNAFLLGRNREAIKHYQREKAAFKGSPEAIAREASETDRAALASVLLQIGRVYARLGVADSARQAYQQVLVVEEDNAQAWGWLAEVSEDEGDLNQALAEARRAFALAPENIEYRYLVGALSFRTGAFDEAAGHLEAVVRQQAWHVGAHYNLGRCLLALGREVEAQQYLDATDGLQQLESDIILAKFALYRNPEDSEYWAQLVTLYRQAGRLSEAREAYNIVRQLNK